MSKMGSGQRERGYLLAPRIQVVLTPVEEAKPDATEVAGPFDAWLVLYVPDGGDPVTVKLAGGPFDSLGALHLIDAVYTTIGEKYAPADALVGAEGLERWRH